MTIISDWLHSRQDDNPNLLCEAMRTADIVSTSTGCDVGGGGGGAAPVAKTAYYVFDKNVCVRVSPSGPTEVDFRRLKSIVAFLEGRRVKNALSEEERNKLFFDTPSEFYLDPMHIIAEAMCKVGIQFMVQACTPRS